MYISKIRAHFESGAHFGSGAHWGTNVHLQKKGTFGHRYTLVKVGAGLDDVDEDIGVDK